MWTFRYILWILVSFWYFLFSCTIKKLWHIWFVVLEYSATNISFFLLCICCCKAVCFCHIVPLNHLTAVTTSLSHLTFYLTTTICDFHCTDYYLYSVLLHIHSHTGSSVIFPVCKPSMLLCFPYPFSSYFLLCFLWLWLVLFSLISVSCHCLSCMFMVPCRCCVRWCCFLIFAAARILLLSVPIYGESLSICHVYPCQ